MSGRWLLGDLAECIADDWQRYDGSAPVTALPQLGCIYMVSKVKIETLQKGETVVMLNFPEFGRDNFWAIGFKKVHPKGEDMRVSRREAVPA